MLVFFVPLIAFFSICNKDKTPAGQTFNSLKEEIDYFVNNYLEVGAAVGVIDKQQEQLVLF